MITQGFLSLLHGLAVTLVSWMQSVLPSPPSFWTDATDAVSRVVAQVPGSVLWFVPVGPVLAAAAAVLVLVLVFMGVRLARRVLSLFTGGGGNA
jgi:hypothetical protein